jgi:hypothetical protein
MLSSTSSWICTTCAFSNKNSSYSLCLSCGVSSSKQTPLDRPALSGPHFNRPRPEPPFTLAEAFPELAKNAEAEMAAIASASAASAAAAAAATAAATAAAPSHAPAAAAIRRFLPSPIGPANTPGASAFYFRGGPLNQDMKVNRPDISGTGTGPFGFRAGEVFVPTTHAYNRPLLRKSPFQGDNGGTRRPGYISCELNFIPFVAPTFKSAVESNAILLQRTLQGRAKSIRRLNMAVLRC